jgi:acyl-CoA reductase-like NAD-dependent aldehyde dehydrogenase
MAVEVAPDFPMFIDGERVESTGRGWLDVYNPATGQLVGRVPAGTEADVDRAVAASSGKRSPPMATSTSSR